MRILVALRMVVCMAGKQKQPFTTENGLALISIIISLLALSIIIDNKPVIGGYTELHCDKVLREDSSSACIVPLDRYDDKIRVFLESRR